MSNRNNSNILIKATSALLVTSMISLGLTGCGSSVKLTEGQEDLVAEYCAQMVLRYDANYKSKLVKVKETATEATSNSDSEESETTSQSEVINDSGIPENHSDVTSDTNDKSSYSDIFGIKDIDINYNGFSINDTYTDGTGNASNLNAREGKKLVVLNYTLTNNNSTAVKIPMMPFTTSIKCKVNGNSYNALVTLLMNALNTYTGDIEAGQSQELVLVFEVPIISENDISNMQLAVSNNVESAIFDLK